MTLKISALIAINNCILSIYGYGDRAYRFSVVNAAGRTYTCQTSFFSLSQAREKGLTVTERLAIDYR